MPGDVTGKVPSGLPARGAGRGGLRLAGGGLAYRGRGEVWYGTVVG